MKFLLALLIAVLASPIFGEVVHLNDGTTIEGELHRVSEGWTVTGADGKVTTVSSSDVKSIEFSKSSGTGDAPEQKLASLRRAVAHQNDIPKIIERFQAFVTQNAGTPAAQEAQNDLVQWQQRLDKGLVRVGDQWVTQDQLAKLQSQARQSANSARILLANGKIAEALTLVDMALAISPHDVALLYLRGVIGYRQNQIVPARDAFQAAEALAPENGAIHNNIAVILDRQRSPMPALNEYAKAMLVLPGDQTILDNVYEALNALPVEFKNKDLAKRVKDTFTQQDATLQRFMAAKGLYRWGSQWINQKDYERLAAERKAVQDKMDSMQKDFDGLKAAILKIDRDITTDEQVEQAMSSQALQTDGYGHTYVLPLPQRYYDLQKDVGNLKSQKVLDERQMADLQKFAAQQKQLMPQEKFTGLYKTFDVEAVPGAPSSSAMTATAAPSPTTAPAAPAVLATPATPGALRTGGVDFTSPHH